MCVSVHGNVVGDSADRCVMTAYHCRCARVRVAGGPFWHVFSPRLHLCLWHSELGLTKERQGGEVGGGYSVPMSAAGWGFAGNVLVAQSHGVTCIHGSGTGSRIHRLCEAEQLASPSTLLLLCLHIDMLGIQFTVYLSLPFQGV